MVVVTLLTGTGAPLVARAAFVFTDIVDSTGHALRLGDERWAEVLRAHNAEIRAAVARHGGEEVSFLGDGFLVLFADAPAAVACAASVQAAFRRFRAEHPDAPLHVRVGVHVGTACREGGDVYGAAVHVASRVAMQAGGDETVVSDEARQELLASGASELEPRRCLLKGLPDRRRVWGVPAGA